jgi:hypothetical protein
LSGMLLLALMACSILALFFSLTAGSVIRSSCSSRVLTDVVCWHGDALAEDVQHCNQLGFCSWDNSGASPCLAAPSLLRSQSTSNT